MSEYYDDSQGKIYIDTEVIAQFAGHAALDCFGIVGMATISVKDGLAKLLKGDNVSKGVSVVSTLFEIVSIDIDNSYALTVSESHCAIAAIREYSLSACFCCIVGSIGTCSSGTNDAYRDGQ